MLFAELSDDLYRLAPYFGFAAGVIRVILSPSSAPVKKDPIAREKADRELREERPLHSFRLLAVLIAIVVGISIYRSW